MKEMFCDKLYLPLMALALWMCFHSHLASPVQQDDHVVDSIALSSTFLSPSNAGPTISLDDERMKNRYRTGVRHSRGKSRLGRFSGSAMSNPYRLPPSPANLLKPDGFQFYTYNERGDMITKQMTIEEIQALIASGGPDHSAIEIQEPQKAEDILAGGKKVMDVVEKVQSVLKSALGKPSTLKGSMPTIPDAANAEWSNILPSILAGDKVDEVVASYAESTMRPTTTISIDDSLISTTIQSDDLMNLENTRATQNMNEAESIRTTVSDATKEPQSEKPMIPVSVITVEVDQESTALPVTDSSLLHKSTETMHIGNISSDIPNDNTEDKPSHINSTGDPVPLRDPEVDNSTVTQHLDSVIETTTIPLTPLILSKSPNTPSPMTTLTDQSSVIFSSAETEASTASTTYSFPTHSSFPETSTSTTLNLRSTQSMKPSSTKLESSVWLSSTAATKAEEDSENITEKNVTEREDSITDDTNDISTNVMQDSVSALYGDIQTDREYSTTLLAETSADYVTVPPSLNQHSAASDTGSTLPSSEPLPPNSDSSSFNPIEAIENVLKTVSMETVTLPLVEPIVLPELPNNFSSNTLGSGLIAGFGSTITTRDFIRDASTEMPSFSNVSESLDQELETSTAVDQESTLGNNSLFSDPPDQLLSSAMSTKQTPTKYPTTLSYPVRTTQQSIENSSTLLAVTESTTRGQMESVTPVSSKKNDDVSMAKWPGAKEEEDTSPTVAGNQNRFSPATTLSSAIPTISTDVLNITAPRDPVTPAPAVTLFQELNADSMTQDSLNDTIEGDKHGERNYTNSQITVVPLAMRNDAPTLNQTTQGFDESSGFANRTDVAQKLPVKEETVNSSTADDANNWQLVELRETTPHTSSPLSSTLPSMTPSHRIPIPSGGPTSPVASLALSLDASQSVGGLDSSSRKTSADILEFARLCNQLAFKFWTAANKGLSTARSLALSPFGMISLLGMIFLGARGSTSDQMNEVLGLDNVATFNPHLIFQNVTDAVSLALARQQGIANAAFVRELFADKAKVRKLMPFYKEQAQQFYEGLVTEVNFATISDLARRRTNLLIRKQTGGRIKDFVKSNAVPLRSPLAAISANVFQTDCNSSMASATGRDGELYFAVSQSSSQLPPLSLRKLVPVPATVWRSTVLAGYEPSLDATAVALGGADKLISTIFLLPGQQGHVAPGDTLDRLEQRLLKSVFESYPSIRRDHRESAWDKLLRVLIPRTGLELQVPKFSHRSVVNATAALKRMGLDQLFSGRADFKGINGIGNRLFLSDVLQMNLFGTCGDENITNGRHHVEIYPASLSSRRTRRSEQASQHLFSGENRKSRMSERAEDKPRLKLDQPFLYFVRHNPTGLILHMGRFNPRLLS